MSEYNRDQWEALLMVQHYLEGLPASEIERLRASIGPYLQFRSEVSRFQREFLSEICTQACFTTRQSACCNRDGIATFFADVVINALFSSEEDLNRIKAALVNDPGGFKCVYLGEKGCVWRLKPIVCEMFLCDRAKAAVLEGDRNRDDRWQELLRKEKQFTWPDKPVLFDELEELFLEAGLKSPLMYCHLSPGLLRVKAQRKRGRR
jgi:hypothetical protein